jgi:Na+/phosphate symporter
MQTFPADDLDLSRCQDLAMEDAPSYRNPFRTVRIKWRPGGADETSSLDVCLGDVLLATVRKLTEMLRMLKCISAEETSTTEKDKCALLAKEVHHQEIVVAECLLSPTVANQLTNDITRLPYRLERIGDMLENILLCLEKKAKDGIQFSAEAHAELDLLFAALLDIMEDLGKAFATSEIETQKSLIAQEKNLLETLASYRQAHWERLWSGACLPQASSMYLDILDSIKWANEYLKKISMTLLEHNSAP